MPKGHPNIMPKHINLEVEDAPLEAFAVSGDDLEMSELKGLLQQSKDQIEVANMQIDELIKNLRETQKSAEANGNNYTTFVQTLDKYHTERFDAIFMILDAVKIINKPFVAPTLDPKE